MAETGLPIELRSAQDASRIGNAPTEVEGSSSQSSIAPQTSETVTMPFPAPASHPPPPQAHLSAAAVTAGGAPSTPSTPISFVTAPIRITTPGTPSLRGPMPTTPTFSSPAPVRQLPSVQIGGGLSYLSSPPAASPGVASALFRPPSPPRAGARKRPAPGAPVTTGVTPGLVGTTGSLAGGASAGTGSAAAAAVRPPKRRSIGERVKEIVPESRLLNELMEAEARLETVAWRRQQAALEAVRVKSTRGQRTIRIIMSSRFSTPGPAYQLDEPTSAGAGGSGDPTPPHWIFRLEAHLLPLAGEATLRAGAASTGRARFSQLLRRVVVEDESGQVAEWERGRGHAGEIDGIELKRRGDREAQLRVLVWPDQGPPRYRLSADLAQLLGMASETRPRVLMALWQYVKLHRLQDPEDRKAIRCNPELARVLGAERVPFASLPLLVAEHLSPPEPVELRFTLTRPDGPHPHPHPDAVAEQAYDLLLDLEEPPQPLGAALRREIDALDDALSAHLTRLHELKLRRDFFLSFAFQPSRFLATLLHQQTRDYILMRSEATGRDPEEERHSSYYLQPLALDAVQQLCNASASASASTVPAPAPAPPPALPLPVLH